jgi:xanthine dehydrogenase YagR molybdenum-binding subunit
MRGPGEASGVFALECAMDELAHALQLDPVELRRRNEPEHDESENRSFSSRSLLQCYDMGAERFGWSQRNRIPRSMRDGRLLIGWGMATSTYPVLFNQANARVRMQADGTVDVEAAASDMGPGTYTSMTQVAADALGLPMDRIRFRLGRSDFPATPPHGGSQTMASVGSAVRAACLALKAQLLQQVVAARRGPFAGADPDTLTWKEGRLFRADREVSQGYADIVMGAGGKPVEATGSAGRDPETANRYSMHAFGAVFAEVAIDPAVRTVRVRRLVGA